MPFAATWVDLEVMILSEIRKREKDKCHRYCLYVESKKKKKKIQMNLFPKQKETRRHKKQTYGYPRGKGSQGRDRLGVWDSHTHTTIYKQDNNQDLLYSTGN